MKKKPIQTQPLRGEKLAKHVMNKILAHPESWRQTKWHCGTQHCFFGHCQIEAGFPEEEDGIVEQVGKLLKIDSSSAGWLSRSERTLKELYEFVKLGYDPDGFSRDGYDRAGKKLEGIYLQNPPKITNKNGQ